MSHSDEPVISVLVADDDEDQRVLIEGLLRHADGTRHAVTCVADGQSALTAVREQVFDVALLDLSMPGLDGLEVLEAVAGDPSRPQVVFVSGRGTVETATRAMKLGAFDFLEKPVDRDRLLTVVWKAARAQRVFSRTERLEAVVTRGSGGVRIVTEDRTVKGLLQLLGRIAPSDVSVLIVGESGTGKELIARELHRLSGRHAEPLVALNCAAVAESLAESELFGHEKGAFTGAVARKMGLIEISHGGTLFLDEVGDLDLALQAKLLRVLESKMFRRVGGVKELPTNFRLVSATNRPLQKLVDEGVFRGDLFYRINAIVLELPPLRERAGDVAVLARHFLSEFKPGDAQDWTIAAEALALLENYSWPGNARELRNVIERSALLCHGTTIRAADLGLSLLEPKAAAGEGAPAAVPLPSLNLDRLEGVAIERALEQTGWHQGRAAELLGVSDRTLHRKIKGLGLRRAGVAANEREHVEHPRSGLMPMIHSPWLSVCRVTQRRRRSALCPRTAPLRSAVMLALMVGSGAVGASHVAAQSDVAFPPEVYAGRRARLVDQLQAPIIVPSEYMIRAGGEKKQEPNFFYLTGVESPYAILVVAPDGEGGVRERLFLPGHREFAGAQYSFQDPRLLDAAWNRLIRRLEPGESAEAATGIAETFALDAFTAELRTLTATADEVFFAKETVDLYAPPGLDPPLTLRQQLEASVSELLGGRALQDATPAIERMRVIKDSFEIDALRRAAEVSAQGLLEAMRRIEPGMNDLEVAGIMEWAWKRGGSPRTAFVPIVASGPDAVSLFTIRSENYNSVNRVMKDGDLVFIDYGAAEWAMYGSDICRTFPVSGRFTEEQKRIYEIVLEAQQAAIAMVRPGGTILEVIRAAAMVFQSHGLEANEDIDRMGADRVWGLMPSPTHYLTQGKGLTRYTAVAGLGVRDIGHHVGLEATDGRDYSTPLEPGMVFTIEPKVYVPELDIAIMIEDVILVTEDGYENLSESVPRSVEEIERIMRGG